MGLFSSRENLDRNGSGFGGDDYLGRLKDKLGKPSEKGDKKGASIFGTDPFLSPDKFVKRVTEDRGGTIFEKTKFNQVKRKNLTQKAYLPKIMGPNIDSKDIAEKGAKELEKGRWGGYGKLSPTERKDLKKIFDASSGGKN